MSPFDAVTRQARPCTRSQTNFAFFVGIWYERNTHHTFLFVQSLYKGNSQIEVAQSSLFRSNIVSKIAKFLIRLIFLSYFPRSELDPSSIANVLISIYKWQINLTYRKRGGVFSGKLVCGWSKPGRAGSSRAPAKRTL